MNRLLFIVQTSFLKSAILSFRYFPIMEALKLPILVARHTRLETVRGGVEIVDCKVKTGIFKLGYRQLNIVDPCYERTKWHVKGKIIIKGTVSLGSGTNLAVAESGELVLGDHFLITGRSTIICRKHIEFGSNVLVSWDVLFMDTDYHSIFNEAGHVINENRPIIIGNNTWIGCRCLILKGSIIPKGCIISAGTTVSGELQSENTIYGLNKKEIKTRVHWEQ